MKDPTFWLLARASGLTAYVLLTLSVLAGLALKSRPFGRAVTAASATDTHRFLSLLALGAIALHAITLVLDQTVHIGLAALLIPGLASYRPIATGLGVFAAELAALIIISFPLRKRIGVRAWRRLALHDVRGLRGGNGARAGSRNGYASPLGLRALPRCGLRRRGCNGLARLESPNPNERSCTCTGS